MRGLAALHVAVDHMFVSSRFQVDPAGGIAMPFFFVLSGFVMTLGYGQTTYSLPRC